MTKITDRYHFFWKGRSPLTNWWKERYTVTRPDGFEMTFNCSEQAMMLEKALLFKDFKTAYEIMSRKNPSEQKNLGREVKNFDSDLWDKVKEDLVYKVLKDKFLFSSASTKEYLRSTQGLELVEASPYDTIWGIGMTEEDEGVEDERNWKGQNLLGKLLTKLRIELYGE